MWWATRAALIGLGIGVGAAAAAACSGENPDKHEAESATTSRRLGGQDVLPALPRWEDAIGGEEQLLDANGTVVASRKFVADAKDLADADSVSRASARGERTVQRIVPVQGLSFNNGLLQTHKYVLRVTPTDDAEPPIAKPSALLTSAPVSPPSVISPSLAAVLSVAAPADLIPVRHARGESVDTFGQTGGTSIAAPQVAGAAMLVKNAFLSAGVTYMDAPGVLFATLLSMTDRSYGAGQRSSGFDPSWGGGRFQLRFFGDGSDHPAGGAWGFDLWEVVIHNNEIINFPIRGTGNEPSTIQQFKVYALVFEQSWRTVADVDLYVRDQNCAGIDLGYDVSFDTKSMVRVGTAAAGKALCVRVKGYAVPPEGRRVVIASYFSVDTSMR